MNLYAHLIENNTVVVSEVKSVDHETENVISYHCCIYRRFARELQVLMCKVPKSADCAVLALICEMSESSLQIQWALLYPCIILKFINANYLVSFILR